MKKQQCPLCYCELEVKDSSPCFVCGFWFEGDELKKEIEKDDFTVYGLQDNSEIVLCSSCYLEEVLANQGDLLSLLGIRKEEATAAIRFLDHAEACMCKDKYCPQCNKRLALLNLVTRNEKNS